FVGKFHAFEPIEADFSRPVWEQLPHSSEAVRSPPRSPRKNPTTGCPSHVITCTQDAVINKEQCPICFSVMGEMISPWGCNHLIHEHCFNGWRENTTQPPWPSCAICRASYRRVFVDTSPSPTPIPQPVTLETDPPAPEIVLPPSNLDLHPTQPVPLGVTRSNGT
ncbi:hypothetical protein PSHT_00794, partial [Puccinia striiformis]